MADLSNNAEGGTNTTVVTTGNSGGASGNAFNTIDSGVNTGTITFATGSAYKGSLGYRVNSTATNGNELWMGYTPTGSRQAAQRYMFRIPSLPASGSNRISAFCNASFTSNYCAIGMTSGGLLTLINNAGAVVATAASGLATNTWYRIELKMDNTSSTAGTADLGVYLGDSYTLESSLSLMNVTGQTFGGGNIGYAVFGKWTGAAIGAANIAMAFTADYDDILVRDTTTQFIGPSSTPGTGMVWDISVKQG